MRPESLEETLSKWAGTSVTDEPAYVVPLLNDTVTRSEIQSGIYIAQVETSLEVIQQAFSSHNATLLAEESIALKRASQDIGSPAMTSIARDLQLIASTTHVEEGGEILEEIRKRIEELKEALES